MRSLLSKKPETCKKALINEIRTLRQQNPNAELVIESLLAMTRAKDKPLSVMALPIRLEELCIVEDASPTLELDGRESHKINVHMSQRLRKVNTGDLSDEQFHSD